LGAPFEVLKSWHYIVAKHGLSGFKVAVQDAFDGFTQSARRNAFHVPALGWFFEVVSQRHYESPVSFVVCTPRGRHVLLLAFLRSAA
jgi:hypothetical protein